MPISELATIPERNAAISGTPLAAEKVNDESFRIPTNGYKTPLITIISTGLAEIWEATAGLKE